ncbi:hypothetical protein [Clostridium sp.]|uniref:hypothetical protein n=1 Tax=Clostridium sp. TaxID=1506 RepID=UPI003216207D
MRKKKQALLLIVVITFIFILTGSYFNNYNLLKQPPSETWSKEVQLGSGGQKNSPVIIKETERLLTAYEDTKKLKICETDLNGKILRTEEYEVNEELLKNVVFTKSSDGYILMYNSSKSGQGYLENIILDKDLNVVNRKIVEGVEHTYQIDSSNIVISYNDKIEVVNTLEDKSSSVMVEELSMVTASASKDGLLVCYLEKDEFFKAVTFKDGIASKPILVTSIVKPEKISYNNMSSSTDGKYGYILIEEYVRNEYALTKLMEFPIDGGETKISTLSVDDSKYIVNTKGSYSEDGGKFYATMSRAFGKKEVQQAIISFVIKDGQASNIEVVTRLRELCIHPYSDEDYIGFLSFKEENVYNVNIASTNQEFKVENNVSRGTEKRTALFYMLEGVMVSVSYIIILGFRWIIPVLVIGGAVTFIDYSFSEKKKKIVYVILSAVGIIAKTYVIVNMFYGTYVSMLPNVIAPIAIGISICLLIGGIVYGYGYFVYVDDFEGIFIGKFSIFMLMDALLSLMVFVPLIA